MPNRLCDILAASDAKTQVVGSRLLCCRNSPAQAHGALRVRLQNDRMVVSVFVILGCGVISEHFWEILQAWAAPGRAQEI